MGSFLAYDQAGEQKHEFAVGFLTMFNDAFQQRTQGFVFLLQNVSGQIPIV